MQRIPPSPRGGCSSRKEGAVDRPVEHADGTGPADDSRLPDGSVPVLDSAEDIESELYCSTREAGVGALSFGPVDDA